MITAQQLNLIRNDENVRIFDCRFNLTAPAKGYNDYLIGHVPNSQYADLNEHLAGPVTKNSGRHPLPDKHVFQDQLRVWGVDECSQIVVYDDLSGAIASRMWWLCQWAGIETVALLDGGVASWVESDLPTTQTMPPLFKPSEVNINYHDQLWVSTENLKAMLSGQMAHLIDARTPIRFRGEQEPIDCVAGHIPGAINCSFDRNLDEKGFFLKCNELLALHQVPDNRILISMCGSGVTACHNLLARKHAGLEMGKLYVGSWSEWIIDKTRVIEKD